MSKLARSAKPARKGGNVRRAPTSADLGFWHQPALMNLTADVLLVAGAVLLLAAGWAAVQRMAVLPLRQLVVTSSLKNVSPLMLEQSVRSTLSGNFLTVDLDAARNAFETLPWVRRADVRKRWPDTIEVAIEEHQAAARWMQGVGAGAGTEAAESRLVSVLGEVFVADTDTPLPVFSGPEGTAARVLARYTEFNAGLTGIGRSVLAVQLSPREAWRVRLDDGVAVVLGRDQDKQALAQRLARLASTYLQLREQLPVAFNTIDMRYPNGFAVRTEAVTSKPARSAS